LLILDKKIEFLKNFFINQNSFLIQKTINKRTKMILAQYPQSVSKIIKENRQCFILEEGDDENLYENVLLYKGKKYVSTNPNKKYVGLRYIEQVQGYFPCAYVFLRLCAKNKEESYERYKGMTLTREKLQNKKEFHEQELKKIENKTLKLELKTLKDEVKVLEDALEEKESENKRKTC